MSDYSTNTVDQLSWDYPIILNFTICALFHHVGTLVTQCITCFCVAVCYHCLVYKVQAHFDLHTVESLLLKFVIS